MTPGPGTIIGGRYRLIEQLGQGGMGSVWKAEHLTLHSTLAVKLIDPEVSAKLDMLVRFKNEAQGAASLRSPHVVQVIDYGADDDTPFIAMELLEGESLAARLARLGRLSNAETAWIVTHISRALVRAHEAGIVHRDLKPDNVFLVPNDEHEIAKVLDFGVAKHAKFDGGKGPTRTGVILGTPAYMSPEQAQGIRTIDTRSDLWSLGVIAYECIVGRVPFESEALGDMLIKICVREIPVPSSRATVPVGFDAWFARACCRDVDQRFQTARELADALRRVLAQDGVERTSSPTLATDAAAQGVVHAITAPPVGAEMRGAGGSLSAPPSAPVSSGSSLPPPVVVGGSLARPPGVTVPGMSIALPPAPTRPNAPLLASVALGTLILGAAVTYAILVAPAARSDHAAASSAAPVTVAPGGANPAAPTPEVTAGSALTGHDGEAALAGGRLDGRPTIPPASSPSVAPVETALPGSSASAKLHVPRAGSPSPLASKPPPTSSPSFSPPPPRGGGDRRLGF